MFKTTTAQPVQPPKNEHDKDFFNGLVTGAVIGAATYYFFKTPEGKILKEELMKTGKTFLDDYKQEHPQVPQKTAQTIEKIQQVINQTETKVQKVVDQAEVKAALLKQEAAKELKNLEKQILDAQKKADLMQQNLEKAASRIERKFFTRRGRSLGK